jgi:hypothetical protein
MRGRHAWPACVAGMRGPWRALNRQPIERTGKDQQVHDDADAYLWITPAV